MASGVNNAVSRVAGLLAIAVFGVVLTHTFESRLRPRIDRIATEPATRAQIDAEVPKMAGAEVEKITRLAPEQRTAVRAAIDESFVSAFRVVMICAAILAVVSAVAGAAISHAPSAVRPTRSS